MMKSAIFALALLAGSALAAVDAGALWNFNDAMHMIALAEPQLEDRIAWNRHTIACAQRASDARAQGWQAAAQNDLGSDLRDAGRLDESLAAFRDALTACERKGRAGAIRIAHWQIANVLRLQGQRDEALAMQLALERDAAAAGDPEPYVYDELVPLQRASGNETLARDAEARAAQLRKK